MCGIYYIFKYLSYNHDLLSCNIDLESLHKNNQSRGPNISSKIVINNNIIMCGAVLHFQGKYIKSQPIFEETKFTPSCMLWNGEIFSGNIDTNPEKSDTEIIFNKILDIEIDCFSQIKKSIDIIGYCSKFINNVRDILESIGGPFSIIYYSSRFNTTIFSRDPLGRRSLLLNLTSNINNISDNSFINELIISSVSGNDKYDENKKKASWIELPITGVFAIFNHLIIGSINNIKCYAFWKKRHINHPLIVPHPDLISKYKIPLNILSTSKISKIIYDSTFYFLNKSWDQNSNEYHNVALILSQNIQHNNYIINESDDTLNILLVGYYLSALASSVYRRVSMAFRKGDDIYKPIMILFSGGIDSTVLTALSHIVLSGTSENLKIPFELINIASGPEPLSTPDRMACIKAFQELQKLPKANERTWKLIFVNITEDELNEKENHIKQLIYPRNTTMDLNIGSALWFGSRGIGKIIDYNIFNENKEIIDDILLRSQLRFGNKQQNNAEKKYIIEHSEYPQLINIIINELITQEHNSDVLLLSKIRGDKLNFEIKKHNCNSLFDLIKKAHTNKIIEIVNLKNSIRGVKLIRYSDINLVYSEKEKYNKIFKLLNNDDAHNNYISQSKIVILGMGADESLGGYSRYKTKKSLTDEIQIDFKRLWERNLGRDDRIISDHGREGRMPFLDEDVLSVLSGNYCLVKIEHICDLTKNDGIGEKILLRTCARMIGLTDISFLIKRAIQFGTRIADKNIKGDTVIS
jgi:asparagine synthetase B (glutamine-hydrolysing)